MTMWSFMEIVSHKICFFFYFWSFVYRIIVFAEICEKTEFTWFNNNEWTLLWWLGRLSLLNSRINMKTLDKVFVEQSKPVTEVGVPYDSSQTENMNVTVTKTCCLTYESLKNLHDSTLSTLYLVNFNIFGLTSMNFQSSA